MGVVYEALDERRRMRVALKKLRRLDAGTLYRFKQEFRALSDISHPNIVTLYELVSDDKDWFFTMELVDGVDLIDYVRSSGVRSDDPRDNDAPLVLPSPTLAVGAPTDVITPDTRIIHPGVRRLAAGSDPGVAIPPDQRRRLDEIVDLSRLLDSLSQLAQALYTLHSQGIVHRDLKPSNVQVTPAGRVVLMDFGIVARTSDNDGSTAIAMGTPTYMAPEQAEGGRPNAAADWYAFGVLLYQALVGKLPFRGPSEYVLALKRNQDPAPPSTFTSDIPPDLEALCLELLSRDPAQRPQGSDVLSRIGVGAASVSRLLREATLVGSESFVGRKRQLDELNDGFREALDDQAICAVVQGASGMGKTTLLRRFVDELGAVPIGGTVPLILSGRCHERESLSFNAFDGVIDGLARELQGEPKELVEEFLPDDVEPLTRLFPVLRSVPGVPAHRTGDGSNLQEVRIRAIEALRVTFQNLGQWRPLVLRLEDLHWADGDSLELLVELLRPPAPRRLLVLISVRTGDAMAGRDEIPAPVRHALETVEKSVLCHRLQVGPLSKLEQALLVATLDRDRRLPPNLDDEFWAEAEGNPLLLNEFARYAAEVPEKIDKRTRPKLDDVIWGRVTRLSETARALLEIIAIAGEPTPLWLLADAIGQSDDVRERASAALRAIKLARIALPGHEPWLNVQHTKIRQTVVDKLPDTRRRFLHLRLAQALERREGSSVATRARHWLAAGERERAARALLAAAAEAIEKLAFERAVELYSDALVATDGAPAARRIAVLAPMGAALSLAGRYYEASERYAEAARLADPEPASEPWSEKRIDLERRAAENSLRSGRVRSAILELSEAVKHLGANMIRSQGSSVISLLARRARLALRGHKHTLRTESEIASRDLDRVDAFYAAATSLSMADHLHGSLVQTQHLTEALKAGEERRVCRALAVETWYLGAAGVRQSKKASDVGQVTLQRARTLDDPFLIGMAQLANAIVSFFNGGVWNAAEEFGAGLDTLSNVSGADWERVTCQYFLCLSLLGTGQWSDLQRRVERSIDKAERRHDMYAKSLFAAEPMTWCLLMADQTDEIPASLENAMTGWSSQPVYLAHYQVAVSRAMLALYQGDGDQAIRALDDVQPSLGRLMIDRIPLMMADYLAYRGRAALLRGELSTANKQAKRLSKVAAPRAAAYSALLHAGIHHLRGQRREAATRVSQALAAFTELKFEPMAAACRYRLGQLVGGSRGEELIPQAIAWFEQRGVVAPRSMIALLTWSAGEGN